MATTTMEETGTGRMVLAAHCACLVGIGLARFAYTPLIPALIAGHWFDPSDAAYLGAANLAGYLAGALLARPMAARAPVATILRAMMVAATAAFFACALPLSFAWFFLWRFTAGYSGGVLMALAAPTVLPFVPAARRGLAGGIIFTGVGLGIAASGTLVPLFLEAGLAVTWCGLGALSLALTLVAWRGWPAATATPPRIASGPAHVTPRLIALYAEYALYAVGLVPHMVFLVDFIARGLGAGLGVGAAYWVIYGLGAVVGPAVTGVIADRMGFALALRCAVLVEAAAVALLAVTDDPISLAVSSLVIGALTPGVVPLVLGRIHEILPPGGARDAAWSLATTAFALGQAGAAYGFSFLFAQGGGYALLFALGGAAAALAFVIEVAATRR